MFVFFCICILVTEGVVSSRTKWLRSCPSVSSGISVGYFDFWSSLEGDSVSVGLSVTSYAQFDRASILRSSKTPAHDGAFRNERSSVFVNFT